MCVCARTATTVSRITAVIDALIRQLDWTLCLFLPFYTVPAREVPRIVASRRRYGLGERVQINCTTGPSRPIARIQWFINDMSVPESYIRRPGDEQQGSKSEKSCSGELPIEASPLQANERWTRSREINESHSVGGGGGLPLLTGNSSSSLEFTLREEHLSALGHFTVRCSSLMSAQFIPEGRCGTVSGHPGALSSPSNRFLLIDVCRLWCGLAQINAN